jgi:hypothetical protein
MIHASRVPVGGIVADFQNLSDLLVQSLCLDRASTSGPGLAQGVIPVSDRFRANAMMRVRLYGRMIEAGLRFAFYDRVSTED